MSGPHEQPQNLPLSGCELDQVRHDLAAAAWSRIGDENAQKLLVYCRRLLATLDELPDQIEERWQPAVEALQRENQWLKNELGMLRERVRSAQRHSDELLDRHRRSRIKIGRLRQERAILADTLANLRAQAHLSQPEVIAEVTRALEEARAEEHEPGPAAYDPFRDLDRSAGLERGLNETHNRFIYTEPNTGDWFGIDRNPPLTGQLDELVSRDVKDVHLERMTDESVWIGINTIRAGAHGGDRYSISLRVRDDGLLDCSLSEWPEEPIHEPEPDR